MSEVSLADKLRQGLIEALDDDCISDLLDQTPLQIVEFAAYLIRLQNEDVSELQQRLDMAGITEAYGPPEFESDDKLEDRMWDISHGYFNGREFDPEGK